MKFKQLIKPLIFILIFLLIFSFLTNLFCRKTTLGAWNHTTKISGFYNEPENEFDVMYFGSSNTYCSFNPLILYEETGIKSYVFATQNQPLWATYYYIKEALKTQELKCIVLDIYGLSKNEDFYDDGVNYSFMDDIPMSLNKIKLAIAAVPKGERFRLLFNFVKYHSRWNELTLEDFTFNRSKVRDYLKGYVLMETSFLEAQRYDIENFVETKSIAEKEMLYFKKIIQLAKDEKINLFLVKTPSNVLPEDQMFYNEGKKIAEENGLEFVNYNLFYDEIGLVLKEDFYDKSHLNYKGSEKFTRFFAKDIVNRFGLKEEKADDEEWNKDLKKYYDYIKTIK